METERRCTETSSVPCLILSVASPWQHQAAAAAQHCMTSAEEEGGPVQLRKEGVDPEKGSPEARAEMLNILEELGFDAEASVTGSDEPSWWQQEQARREEAASSSAAASAEAAVQQRQEQRQMQAEAEAEGARAFLVPTNQPCMQAEEGACSAYNWRAMPEDGRRAVARSCRVSQPQALVSRCCRKVAAQHSTPCRLYTK